MLQRSGDLTLIRQPRYDHWQDITSNIIPYAGRYLVSQRDAAANRYQDIIDETAIHAQMTLEAGLVSLRNNPSVPWHRSQTPDPDLNLFLPVRQWLWRFDEMARRIMRKSNTNLAFPHLYGEEGSFGTAASIVVDDFNTVVHNHLLTAGEFTIATNSRGRVDTIYRTFQMSAIEMVEEFGEDKVSQQVKENARGKLRKNQDSLVDVMHVIEPRHAAERDGDDRLSRNMPWKSVYFEKDQHNGDFLRISGHREFRGIVPRWRVNGGDFWGEGPGTMALGSSRELQESQLIKARVMDHQGDPSLQIPSAAKGRDRDLLPGGRLPYDQNTPHGGVRPTHEVPLRLDFSQTNIEDIRSRIERSFFVPQLQPIAALSDTTLRTAEEVIQRRAEGLTILGPVDFRQRDEMDVPMLEIIYGRIIEENLMPPPPPELEGMPIDIEFIGPLAQALKNSQAQQHSAFRRHLGEIATFQENVVDGYDGDADLVRVSDHLGVDPDLIVPGEQIALIRQARAEAEKAQAQIEAMAVQAGTAKDMAAAGTTDPSVLTDLMAGATGQ